MLGKHLYHRKQRRQHVHVLVRIEKFHGQPIVEAALDLRLPFAAYILGLDRPGKYCPCHGEFLGKPSRPARETTPQFARQRHAFGQVEVDSHVEDVAVAEHRCLLGEMRRVHEHSGGGHDAVPGRFQDALANTAEVPVIVRVDDQIRSLRLLRHGQRSVRGLALAKMR